MTEQDRTNRDWFNQLYAEQYPLLYNHACWYLKNLGITGGLTEELAHDGVQLTFSAAWQRVESLREMAWVNAWLFRVLRNKLSDLIREELRLYGLRQRLEAAQPGAEEDGLADVDFRLLLAQHLTPEEQELVQRIYLNGERPADLCREMGLKRSALSMRLRRIREKLKKYLD